VSRAGGAVDEDVPDRVAAARAQAPTTSNLIRPSIRVHCEDFVRQLPSRPMADAASLDDRLEQIGAQLDWVREYL
jgi:hypothetical protein